MYKRLLLIAVFSVSVVSPIFAQDTQPSGDTSLQTRLNQLLANISDLQQQLKGEKGRKVKTTARKLKLISKGLIKAVNLIPPSSCLDKLKTAMDDFYALTSELGTGIACGPPIVPPFLGRIAKTKSITPDCILPDQLSEPFSEVYGLYTEARDIFHTDLNSNNIPDSCE